MKPHCSEDTALYLNAISESPARDLIYELAQIYARYMDLHHISVEGEKLTSTDSHTLKHICQNPGVTVSELVSYWGKTKGTISAQITRLEEKNLVKKEKGSADTKKNHIYPTEKGLLANKIHTEYDLEEVTRLYEHRAGKYSWQEMEKFWEMLGFYKDFLESRINQQ